MPKNKPTPKKYIKGANTREAILSIAIDLFQREGYDNVTMRALADASGLALGGFYYHFESKEAIVLEFYHASLRGQVERTKLYLATQAPSLDTAMEWICRDRFAEFRESRSLLRVLAQRLDPHETISPWHPASRPLREQSVDLFQQLVKLCLPKLDPGLERVIAQGLWLHHLAVLAYWTFDRSKNSKATEGILLQSHRIWKSLPPLLRIPGMKSALALFLTKEIK